MGKFYHSEMSKVEIGLSTLWGTAAAAGDNKSEMEVTYFPSGGGLTTTRSYC
jgi:hypothetical protein